MNRKKSKFLAFIFLPFIMQRLPARDNDRLALGADNAINEGAILEDQHCGNALNAESGGSLRVLVNVSFATE